MTDKPQPQTLIYYDYVECSKYLQAKYGFNEHDRLGKFGQGRSLEESESIPYQNFWHWVVEQDDTIHNDAYFTMCEWWGEGAEDWQRVILGYYLAEFGDGEPGDRSISFNVWW